MKDEKENMPLVDRVTIVAEVHSAVCQLLLRLWNTTLATQKLCGQKANTVYRYVLLCIVMRQGRGSEATEAVFPFRQKSPFIPGCVQGAII